MSRPAKVICLRYFAGPMPFTPDFLRILSEVRYPNGFIVAAGHGDKGTVTTPASGKVIGEFMVKGRNSVWVEPFGFSRFNVID